MNGINYQYLNGLLNEEEIAAKLVELQGGDLQAYFRKGLELFTFYLAYQMIMTNAFTSFRMVVW